MPDFMQIINIAILLLALFFLVLAVVYFVRGFVARGDTKGRRYNVGRQEARISMLGSWLTAIVFSAIGIVLLVIGGASILPSGASAEEPVALPSPTLPVSTPTEDRDAAGSMPTPTADATPTAPPTLSPEATVTEITDDALAPPPTFTPAASDTTDTTPAPVATPVETPTQPPNSAPSARVNSPNGLYMRTVPGGEVVELIAHEAIVFLLEGEQTVDNVVWRLVESQNGNRGWVAADYLVNE
ncbi:MAG: hypothetical protein M9941_00615 [Anaerolineae bacterium]|nr:hypothetical protein [Anaerolineae bacterium]MCO5187347.1 hypothetical protein [Anaerolineae bacterium]MCO5196260.1 hypothetical protein [Anaerolineae bacterium]